jgi:hypothetical protein
LFAAAVSDVEMAQSITVERHVVNLAFFNVNQITELTGRSFREI